MMTLETTSFLTPNLRAICACARFWSKRVNALKFSAGIEGAYFLQMNAFVLAGLPGYIGDGIENESHVRL